MPQTLSNTRWLQLLSPLLLVLFLLAAEVPLPVAATRLVQLQLVFRHGIRNPLHLSPNDPYAARYNTSLGQLTPAGTQQMRELGQFVRQYYAEQGLLPDRYDPNQVWATSTDTDRTLASGQAFLSGLFPNQLTGHSGNGSAAAGAAVAHQTPVPLHSAARETDILKPTSYTCPARDRLIKAAMTGSAYRAEENRVRDFLSRLASATGEPSFNLSAAWTLGSSAQMWLGMGLRLPQWLSFSDYQQLQLMRLRKYEMKFDDNPAVRKFCGGPLLNRMLTSARAKLSSINSPSGSRRSPGLSLIIYSGHDSTVASLASALNLGVARLGSVPPPASLLAMEVYSDATVRFVYRNSTEHRPFVLKPPACGREADCQLERMSSIEFPSLGAVNLAYECQRDTLGALASMHPVVSLPLVLLLILTVCIGLIGLAVCCNKLVCRRLLQHRNHQSVAIATSLRSGGHKRKGGGRDYAYKPLINAAGEADDDDENDEINENARL